MRILPIPCFHAIPSIIDANNVVGKNWEFGGCAGRSSPSAWGIDMDLSNEPLTDRRLIRRYTMALRHGRERKTGAALVQRQGRNIG